MAQENQVLASLQNETTHQHPSFDAVNLTTPEAAAYCRMAVPTFRQYLSRGEISGIKLGKAWLFTQSDLDTFLNRYRTKSNEDIAQAANQILGRARR